MDITGVTAALTLLGGILGTVVAYKPVERMLGKLVDRWSSSGKADDKELARYRLRDTTELAALKTENVQLRKENDTLQQRYYEQRVVAAEAVRDVEHYQRIAQVATSAANRTEVLARGVVDALPPVAPGSG